MGSLTLYYGMFLKSSENSGITELQKEAEDLVQLKFHYIPEKKKEPKMHIKMIIIRFGTNHSKKGA